MGPGRRFGGREEQQWLVSSLVHTVCFLKRATRACFHHTQHVTLPICRFWRSTALQQFKYTNHHAAEPSIPKNLFSEVLVRELQGLGEVLRGRECELGACSERLEKAVSDAKSERTRQGFCCVLVYLPFNDQPGG